MTTYVFDIDGTICTNTYGKYESAEPFRERINFINQLFKDGNTIKYFTARGSTTNIDWKDLTSNQLKEWGALYHELILGKPYGDIFIDDKAFNCDEWIFPLKKTNNSKGIDIFNDVYKKNIQNHNELVRKILNDKFIPKQLYDLSKKIKNSFKKKGKVILAGNGGSFADAQHIAAEFICKFKNNRVPLPAITLGTNSSSTTAIGNDYSFNDIFSRELLAIGKKNDTLIALSTSGNSQNIINLINQAISMDIPFYVLSGKDGGKLGIHQDQVIKIPSEITANIQEMHILIGHIICMYSETEFL